MGLRTVMNLLAFGSEDNAGASASSHNRADSGAFLAARDCSDDGSDAGAPCDNSCVTLLRRLGFCRECVGRDGDRPAAPHKVGAFKAEAGSALHFSCSLRINDV